MAVFVEVMFQNVNIPPGWQLIRKIFLEIRNNEAENQKYVGVGGSKFCPGCQRSEFTSTNPIGQAVWPQDLIEWEKFCESGAPRRGGAIWIHDFHKNSRKIGLE